MNLKGLGLFFGMLLIWFALNRWILPWLGVSTCMSGSCAVDLRPTVSEDVSDGAEQERDVR